MDSGTLIALSVVLGFAFFICSQAKDKNGKKYGLRKMSRIWAVAVGVLGAQALYKMSVQTGDGETEIPLVAVILVLVPIIMISSNIFNWLRNRKSDPGDSTNGD